MSSSFSRNKGKRQRSSSSSEANNSFVKSVTSRVSGLLPSTITKWFSSPSSSANGSVPAAEATDCSTDDEAVDSVVMTQPPLKKMRFSPGTNSKFNNFDSIDNGNQSYDVPKPIDSCNTFSVIQSPPGKSTFRRETNFVSTPIRPAEDTPILTDDRIDKEKNYFTPQLTVTQIGRSIEKKRKSLFNNESQSPDETTINACIKSSLNSVKNPKQPSFKASLLGSPFYAGRTMYGGAASSLYMDQPNIKQTKVAVVQDSGSTDNSMSHAARRVMDLLEHYASPLVEAKRIPHYTRGKHNDSLTNVSMNSSISDRANKTKSYKTQELHVPSIASFLRVKQRSRLMDSTTAARQIIASQSSSSEFNPYPSRPQKDTEKDQNKLTTKVTSRLTRPRRGEASEINNEIVTPIELPTGVLQINKDNLPKFSFAATIVPNSASTLTKLGTSSEPIAKRPLTIPKIPVDNANKDATQNEINDKNKFKFASPIRISKEPHHVPSVRPNFIFGSPDRNVDKEKDEFVSSVVGVCSETKKITAPKSNDWKCADCLVPNKPDVDKCVCCGGKKPSQEKSSQQKCSVCKIANSQPNAGKCVNCAVISSKVTIADKLSIAPASDKWNCEDCLVKNDATSDKCVCCGGKNTKNNDVANKPQNKESPWRCDECWVSNKNDVEKCIACGAARPSAAPSTVVTSTPAKPVTDSLLTNIVKSQWECSSCLVSNGSEQTKCVCCETPKPGSAKEPQKKLFNFGVPNTTFKFGIAPTNQTSTNVTDDKSAAATSKKAESEKNNNNLSSTPNFTFGIPAKKAEGIKPVPEENSKSTVTFKFGQPSTVPDVPVTTEKSRVDAFKFTSDAKASANDKTETKAKESEQEVPKLQDQPKSVPASTPAAFEYFAAGITVPSKTETSDKKTPPEKKESNSSTLDKQSQNTPKNNFTFGLGSGTNNLFSTPTTTSSNATAISFTPVKPTSASSITSTMLFPKNDAPKSTSESTLVFSKNETSVTASPTPVFGFGSNSASLPTSDTKPTFNFSLGSSKSETTPVFKGSFGTNGSDVPASSFSLGSAAPAPAAAPSDGGANAAEPKSNLFGTTQKENIWPPPNLNNSSNNLFVPSTSTNSTQKPASFTFGSSTTFSSGNTNLTPTFGNGPTNNTLPAFGSSTAATPAFGSSQQAASPAPVAFGSSQQGTNSVPSFGSSQTNTGIIPSFGSSQNTSLTPSFGQPAASSTFGASQQNTIGSSPFGTSQQNSISSPTFGGSQQPAATPFGSSIQQGAGSTATFGAGVQTGVNSSPAPVFGTNTSSSNVFGMSSPNMNSQPSLFSNPVQNQAPPMFGSGGGAAGGAPGGGLGLFGSPAAPAPTPAFPSANASMPSLTPGGPTPAFNFGAQPQNNGMFGFGQQPQQAGVCNFGATPGPSPQVQFNMGSSTGPASAAPGMASRRIRKPVRRRRNDENR